MTHAWIAKQTDSESNLELTEYDRVWFHFAFKHLVALLIITYAPTMKYIILRVALKSDLKAPYSDTNGLWLWKYINFAKIWGNGEKDIK